MNNTQFELYTHDDAVGGKEYISLPVAPLNYEKHDGVRDKRRDTFNIQNRRYLGNKHKLIQFIRNVVQKECGAITSFCDLFAGTGAVGHGFNEPQLKVISNDILYANYVCLKSFLYLSHGISGITEKLSHLNNLPYDSDNYFSLHFGDTYFSLDNARKIGAIREEIEKIYESEIEREILLCSLIYATDKVANTVGHYDAFCKKLENLRPLTLLMPNVQHQNNAQNEIYNLDASTLIKKVECDVLYLDPPYNSRQYSDTYHILENLSEWKEPEVSGIAKKMNRDHKKSQYCLKSATKAFSELIKSANCQHILLSYNNTQSSRDSRSNARISDDDICSILSERGDIKIFEQKHKAFTAGKSSDAGNVERIFCCKVQNG